MKLRLQPAKCAWQLSAVPGRRIMKCQGWCWGGGRTDRPSGCKELTGETQLAVRVKSVRRCGKIPGLGFFVLLRVPHQPPSQVGCLLPSAANILQISLSLSHPVPLLLFISPIPFFPLLPFIFPYSTSPVGPAATFLHAGPNRGNDR